jgi:hypothetical protein
MDVENEENKCCPNPDCASCRNKAILPSFLEMLDNLPDVELYPALEIIKRLYANIQKFPDQVKYRTVPLSAPSISRDLAPVDESMKFLLSSGWATKDGSLVYNSDLEFIQLANKLIVDAEKVRVIRRKYLDEQKRIALENSYEEREKAKLLEQIHLDRNETSLIKAKSSIATPMQSQFGQNFLNNLRDIGIDVNKGG